MGLLKNAMSLLKKRLIQKHLQPWRRSGGAVAEMGTHDGSAHACETRAHACGHGAWSTRRRRGVAAPREQRDALGVRAGRRTAFPPHPPTARGGPQAQDQTTATGDGAATHQT